MHPFLGRLSSVMHVKLVKPIHVNRRKMYRQRIRAGVQWRIWGVPKKAFFSEAMIIEVFLYV